MGILGGAGKFLCLTISSFSQPKKTFFFFFQNTTRQKERRQRPFLHNTFSWRPLFFYFLYCRRYATNASYPPGRGRAAPHQGLPKGRGRGKKPPFLSNKWGEGGRGGAIKGIFQFQIKDDGRGYFKDGLPFWAFLCSVFFFFGKRVLVSGAAKQKRKSGGTIVIPASLPTGGGIFL